MLLFFFYLWTFHNVEGAAPCVKYGYYSFTGKANWIPRPFNDIPNALVKGNVRGTLCVSVTEPSSPAVYLFNSGKQSFAFIATLIPNAADRVFQNYTLMVFEKGKKPLCYQSNPLEFYASTKTHELENGTICNEQAVFVNSRKGVTVNKYDTLIYPDPVFMSTKKNNMVSHWASGYDIYSGKRQRYFWQINVQKTLQQTNSCTEILDKNPCVDGITHVKTPEVYSNPYMTCFDDCSGNSKVNFGLTTK